MAAVASIKSDSSGLASDGIYAGINVGKWRHNEIGEISGGLPL